MTLTLDPESQQRIQREIDLGHFHEPSEVIAHALDLLQAEHEWLSETRDHLDARLDKSIGQIERGEGIPGDHLLEILAQRRAQRTR